VTQAAAGLALLLVLALSSCGEDVAAPCDDARFLDQSEELYAALAAARNATERAGPDGILVDDLRSGAAVLDARLKGSPPCSDELAVLADRERAAISDLERAADLLGSGDGAVARGLLDEAVAALGAAEKQLR
jgi:hypothetical protein